MQHHRNRLLLFILFATIAIYVYSQVRPLAHQTEQIIEIRPEGKQNTILGVTVRAMNASRQVVGEAQIAGGRTRAFLWNSGHFRLLELPYSQCSLARAINDKGQIVGFVLQKETGTNRAFLYEHGTVTWLDSPSGGETEAYGINNQAEVVGRFQLKDGAYHACFWRKGTLFDLGTLGGRESAALGINDQGEIVGKAQNHEQKYHAFHFFANRIHDLGTLGGSFSEATAISSSGRIVGNSDTAFQQVHAFQCWKEGMQDITPPEAQDGRASSVNNRWVVSGKVSAGDGEERAVLFERKMRPLSHSVPDFTGTLMEAVSIDDTGNTLVTARDKEFLRSFLIQKGH